MNGCCEIQSNEPHVDGELKELKELNVGGSQWPNGRRMTLSMN